MFPIVLLCKREPSADYVCFYNHLDFCASITERLQLPLWICAVWLMPTLGGHPCGRVHPARTLKGEFDVCHADPGCHVFVYLWEQVTLLVAQFHIDQLVDVMIFKALFLFSPWHSCYWDNVERSSVQACVKRPFHRQCPEQTSPPVSGPRQSLTVGRVTNVNSFKQTFN